MTTQTFNADSQHRVKARIGAKLLPVLAFVLFAIALHAQDYTTFSASNITDPRTNQKMASGTVCVTETDDNDKPVPYRLGSGGNVLSGAWCGTITNGVASYPVPNAATTIPQNIKSRIIISDSQTERLRYTKVLISGTTFNFDSYIPTVGPFSPTQTTTDSLRTNSFVCVGCWPLNVQLDNPDTTISGKFGPKFYTTVNLVDVECTVDTGTLALQLEIRTSPFISGTSVFSSPMTCSSTPSSSPSFAVTQVPAGSYLKVIVQSTTGSPSALNLAVKY